MPPLRAAIGYLALSGPLLGRSFGGEAMSSEIRGSATRRRHPVSAMLVAGAMVGVLGASGCSIIHAVRKVTHAIEGNKQTVDSFASGLQSGEGATFEATYVTTGAAPATITYAVQPPNGVAFVDMPSAGGTGGVDLVVNSSGEYSCSSGSGAPTCQKLGKLSSTNENQIFDFYTPAHWVNFLKDFALAAGFAGDKVSSSTMTVNGFAMNCVDFVASGVPGTSTICSTSQGILGYVKVASDSTSFEIKSYSSSPSASLFQLPPGAKVVTEQSGNVPS
jgi:hypothetical protein